MRVFETPALQLITELYTTPLSSENWNPPDWGKKDKQGTVLGTLSPASWRIVGVMRDVAKLLTDAGVEFESGGGKVPPEEFSFRAALLGKLLAVFFEEQVTTDLIASGVPTEEAMFFCVREGGDVLVCSCKKIMGMMSFGDFDLFGEDLFEEGSSPSPVRRRGDVQEV